MIRNLSRRLVLIVAAALMITLTAMILCTPENAHADARDVEWGQFQNSVDNNGVTDRETPGSYKEAALKWGKQLVQGYTTSFTPPVIIDGYIYTASTQNVFKIDKETGEIVKSSEKMQIDVSYAMHPMTYVAEEDALYLPLLNGRVQCIDADDLSLKWISKTYNGTQALSPITYKDGYVYTGIWEKEVSDGIYFCLDAKTGKTVWTLRPSEIREVTTAEELPTFEKPAGQAAPDNYYTYTALITVEPEDGYTFDKDKYGRYWLYDESGKKVTPSGVSENAVVPATVNGLTAELDYPDSGEGEAVLHVKYSYYNGTFTQQGNRQESGVKVTGLDTPVVGQNLDTSASISSHLRIKNIEWKKGDIPHGFYWAGCYANDDYVVFGSDDGQNNTFGESGAASYTMTSILYSCDRRTGEVVDKLENCKGDIRSTIVHHNGYLYFTSKGGVLYKVKLGADGKFSKVSSFDTGAMMTASPVVHNGRIYVGVCGMAGQFNADGGHKFCVFKDDEELVGEAIYENRIVGTKTIPVMVDGTGSYQYSVDIAGYPQASPVLSTYGSGSSGKVRLYFTFNAFPGGIYFMEDTPTTTKEDNVQAEPLFRPETDMQQYCISPIAVDNNGTLYIKNDSGYMMAVSCNKAYLDDITVYAGDDEVEWEHDFRTSTLNYVLTAPDGFTSVDYVLQVPDGMTATINGQNYTSGKFSVPISENASATIVTVTKQVGSKLYKRTYTLNMKTASNNANLAGLAITDNNTAPTPLIDDGDKHTNNLWVGFDPVFEPATTKYVSREYKGRKEFLNVWVAKADSKATVKVYPVDSVGNDLVYTNDDGTIPDKGSAGKMRFPVYFIKGKISAEVRIEVTSSSGKVTQSYNVELVRSEDNVDVGKEPLYVTPANAVLYTEGGRKTLQAKAMIGEKDVTSKCIWTSSRPSKVTVDGNGVITSQGEEVAADNPISVWASYGAQDTDDRPISVVVVRPVTDAPSASIDSGTYDMAKNVILTSPTPGAKIYYNIGDPSKAAVEKPTEKSTLYSGPIALAGIAGERTQYKIRTIAVSDNHTESKCVDYDYIIDMVEPADNAEIAGLDAPEADVPLDTEIESATQGVTVDEIEWYKVRDGQEILASGAAEADTDYIARIKLAADTQRVVLSGDTLAKINGKPAKSSLTDRGHMTVEKYFSADGKVREIVLAGMKSPAGGREFFDDVFAATDGISIESVTWRTADGETVPAKPEYDTEYRADVVIRAEDGVEIADEAPASVVVDGNVTTGTLSSNTDGTYTVKVLATSTKFVLDTSSGTGISISPASLNDLENGILIDDIRRKLAASCKVTVISEAGESVVLDSDSVFWDEEFIKDKYDETDLKPSPFGAAGRVTLPKYMDANGSSREVVVVVNIKRGTVDAPVFTPKAGIYKTAQNIVMSSATPGAAIFYTRGDEKGTKTYETPITITGTYGKKVSIAFKAYAMAQGIKSKTITYTITIDRTAEAIAAAKKYKVTGLKVKAKSKKFTVSWKKTKGATGYQVQYKLKTAKKWSNLKKLTKLKVTSKKLKKGKKYQFRVRAYTKISGSLYYGKWSAAKTAKCK